MARKQGCNANKKRVGMHPKKQPFWNSFQLILNQNVKKVWERRSHAFPPHYTTLVYQGFSAKKKSERRSHTK